jgi:hypothetical protein
MAAHAEKACLEGDPCACRRFGENHGHALILEGLVIVTGFEFGFDFAGQVQGGMNLIGGKIGDVQKIAFHGKASLKMSMPGFAGLSSTFSKCRST